VHNLPGARSLIAENWLANAAPKDGTSSGFPLLSSRRCSATARGACLQSRFNVVSGYRASDGIALALERVVERAVATQRDEIARLKGRPGRRNIKSSAMEKANRAAEAGRSAESQAWSTKTKLTNVEKTVKAAAPHTAPGIQPLVVPFIEGISALTAMLISLRHRQSRL
jgi:hypothetical protein